MASADEDKINRTILVAVDDGDHSMYALVWALDVLLIGRTSSAKDRIVGLYAKPSYATLTGPAFVLTTEAVYSLEKYDSDVISQISTTVKEICADRHVDVEMKVLTGDPRDVIMETVEKLKPDFLVMGSHGFGPIKRALLGSVSDFCSHHVKCPVLIVKKPESSS